MKNVAHLELDVYKNAITLALFVGNSRRGEYTWEEFLMTVVKILYTKYKTCLYPVHKKFNYTVYHSKKEVDTTSTLGGEHRTCFYRLITTINSNRF